MSRPKLPDFSEVMRLAEQTDCRVSLKDLARMHKHGEYSEQAVSALWPDATPRAKAAYMGWTRYTGKPCKKCGNTDRLVSNRDCVRCAFARVKAYRENNATYTQRCAEWQKENREYLQVWFKAHYAKNRDMIILRQRAYRARRAAAKEQQPC